MTQQVVYCFTNIFDKILLHILGFFVSTVQYILAQFLQMLLPL